VMDIINNKNYVDRAETVITGLIEDAKNAKANRRYEEDYDILSTSQLRKQLSMTAELFTRAEGETSESLSSDLTDAIEYLRVQFVYQAGREITVRKFIEKAEILQILKTIQGSREDFLTYCRYMEALVAFRKYYGKKDS